MSEIKFTRLEKVLNDYGLTVVANYRRELAAPKVVGRKRVRTITNSTGKLSKLVHPVLEKKGDNYILSIDFGVGYWEYLEYGTGPARGRAQYWPRPASIMQWIKDKPVIPYKGSNGKIPTTKQLAFLIGRAIYEDGTPALHMLNKSLANEDDILAACSEALEADIEDWIRELIDNL